MDKKLKPCPFCGGEVKIHPRFCLIIKCHYCGATMSFDNDICNSAPEKAIDFYNNREGINNG